ncbi:MAG TPA: hypothetical protein VIL48_01300 [Acidimicrobiales bacterium]
MLARRLTPVLALAAVAGLAASGCASQAVGVRVGDTTLSQADVMDELDAWANNEALFPPGQPMVIEGDAVGSYSQEFVGDVLLQRIRSLVAEQILEERGLEVTDADRADAERALLDSGFQGGALDGFTDDYRARLIDDQAYLNVLAEELGPQGANEALAEAAATTEIEVNPRFGDWDEDELAVAPPAGPTPRPDAAAGAMPGATGPAPAG